MGNNSSNFDSCNHKMKFNLFVNCSKAVLELDGESASFMFTETLTPRGTVYLGGWNGKGESPECLGHTNVETYV